MAKRKKKQPERITIFHHNKHKIRDPKVAVEPMLDSFTSFIEVGADGQTPVIPVDKVEHMMAENEEMRETLMEDYLDLPTRIYHILDQSTTSTTKQVKQTIGYISNLTGGIMTPKDIYAFVFDVVLCEEDIKQCEPNESLLHLTWRLGYLPIAVMYLNCFRDMVNIFKYGGTSDFDKLLKKVRKSRKKMNP